MEKIDYLYLSLERFKELRKQFRDLWQNEPIKLNSFIYNGEFALYDLRMVLLTPQLYTFVIDYHYSKKEKKLICSDENNGYEGEIKNMYVLIDNFYSKDIQGEIKSDISVYYTGAKQKQRLWNALAAQYKTPADWVSDLAIIFYTFNLVAMSLPQKIKEKNEKDTKTIQVKKNGSKTYKSVVYLKHTYILDEDFKLTKSDVKHIIKCPCWGVRGHPRHLKSGKVVYVKPYKKGKDRNNLNSYIGKTYSIGD